MSKFLKITPIIIVIILLSLLFISFKDFTSDQPVVYGVTFSQVYAEELGLDWRQTYLKILNDLQPAKLRLIAYWNRIEKEQDDFDWADLDWQVREAEKRGVPVILAIGRRVPRWPECHDPQWLTKLTLAEQQEQTLEWLKDIVVHYRDYQNIRAWQIENEPLLTLFGCCPKYSVEFIRQEIALVKDLDKRPIIITDSGELSLWLRTMGQSDILGTTMYRIVWNKYFGYWQHFYPPATYYYRSQLAKWRGNQEVIVVELQGEPWAEDKSLRDFSIVKIKKHFDLADFQNNVKFAQRSGFTEVYLWGAEWWYFMKLKGEPDYWNYVRELMNS